MYPEVFLSAATVIEREVMCKRATIWIRDIAVTYIPHTQFLFVHYFLGFSGGETCNCEWQHAMNALSTAAEAQSGTAVSRCF